MTFGLKYFWFNSQVIIVLVRILAFQNMHLGFKVRGMSVIS